MPLRLFCTLFLIVSACAFPLFFTIGIGLFSVIWFRNYFELIPIYLLHDVVYGIPTVRFFHTGYVMTICAIVLVVLTVFIRKNTFDGGYEKSKK